MKEQAEHTETISSRRGNSFHLHYSKNDQLAYVLDRSKQTIGSINSYIYSKPYIGNRAKPLLPQKNMPLLVHPEDRQSISTNSQKYYPLLYEQGEA